MLQMHHSDQNESFRTAATTAVKAWEVLKVIIVKISTLKKYQEIMLVSEDKFVIKSYLHESWRSTSQEKN